MIRCSVFALHRFISKQSDPQHVTTTNIYICSASAVEQQVLTLVHFVAEASETRRHENKISSSGTKQCQHHETKRHLTFGSVAPD